MKASRKFRKPNEAPGKITSVKSALVIEIDLKTREQIVHEKSSVPFCD